MSLAIFLKLIAIFAVVALGWVAGRARWLGQGDVARVLANAAFFLFIPALLFRTTARIDLSAMPWVTLAAFFVPALALLVAVYLGMRRYATQAGPASPSVRAISATFGNTVQLGIPLATALFGETGLSVHLAIVSLHALTLLTLCTALVELDLARAHARSQGTAHSLAATLLVTVRNTVIQQASMHQPQRIHWECDLVSTSSSVRNSTAEVVFVTGTSRLETAKPIIGPPRTIFERPG